MRFVELVHNSENIGDDIQTFASSQLLPEVSGVARRDELNLYSGPPAAVVMSGWFSHYPQNWPPAPQLTPIFMGFHMSDETASAYSEHGAYFKKFEPIGCRDIATAEHVRSWGVEAYTSYCATLTLPPRSRAPANGVVAIVDVPRVPIPPVIERRAIRLWHTIAQVISLPTRAAYARDLLTFYRDHVSLLITGRLHAALPCLAMGIPVVFFGDPNNARTRPLTDLGVSIHPPRTEFALGEIDWSPPPVDVSAVAQRFSDDLTERVRSLA